MTNELEILSAERTVGGLIYHARKKVWDDLIYNILKMALGREPYIVDKQRLTFHHINPAENTRTVEVLLDGIAIGYITITYGDTTINGHFIPINRNQIDRE